MSTRTINKDETGKPHKASWHYRSVIGKLNYLEKLTRGELAYAVHQCARFCEHPKESHSEAVHRIVRFLVATKKDGIIMRPDKSRSVECFADADFCGLWDKDRAEHDPITAKSRSGYVVMFMGCPILWASKMQTEVALSSTESEYISLSTAMRQVIPLMDLLKELQTKQILNCHNLPKVYCKAFEDNIGALELARLPKMRPRTKHINNKYHHFWDKVAKKEIEVLHVGTEDQLADLFTKPLCFDLFHKFTRQIFGWSHEQCEEQKQTKKRECEVTSSS